jgi:hypothetical protein
MPSIHGSEQPFAIYQPWASLEPLYAACSIAKVFSYGYLMLQNSKELDALSTIRNNLMNTIYL